VEVEHVFVHVSSFEVSGTQIPGRQVAIATKFCTVVPNICGTSILNLLYVTRLVLRILRELINFCVKFVHPCLKVLNVFLLNFREVVG
jgi:hypothetical protein